MRRNGIIVVLLIFSIVATFALIVNIPDAQGTAERMFAHQGFQIQPEDFDKEKNDLDIFTFVALLVGATLLAKESNRGALYLYWRKTRHWHIKLWDSLHEALARGIIHSKTLDCV